jgi:hypothetical protein
VETPVAAEIPVVVLAVEIPVVVAFLVADADILVRQLDGNSKLGIIHDDGGTFWTHTPAIVAAFESLLSHS